MPRRGILLQMTQHGPSQHVGKKDVQGDGGGMVLTRQGKSIHAVAGYEDLEPAVASQIAQQPRIVWVILHNQQNRILSPYNGAVVTDQLQLLRNRDRRQLQGRNCRSCLSLAWPGRRRGGSIVGLGQIQRESASLPGRTTQLNLSTQKARQLATDGQPQSCSAVLAAGSSVCLLKSLEDDSLLLRR